MLRAIEIGGSFGGLTAALLLRDQGWDVDVLARSPNPLEGRGAGIVIRPTTVRYLVERAGKRIGDIGTSECASGRVAEFEGTQAVPNSSATSQLG